MDIIQKLKIKPKQENKIDFEVNIKKGAIKVLKKTQRVSTKEDVDSRPTIKLADLASNIVTNKAVGGVSKKV